jgi:glycosyltransferase involved in cell wall biosynthesis
MKISVVIITYNEEDRLEAALSSVEEIASEIIIVDSYSTDDTIKIAKEYTDRVYQRKWTNFSDQKNFANSKASYPWILSLDADEKLSPELKDEIKALMQSEHDYTGFSVPRMVFYLGRWIRHSGWYPDRKIRLFRKDQAHWEGEYVHESLVIEGNIKKLKGFLYHFTYRNIHDHLDRINLFSDLGARKIYAQNKKSHWYHFVFIPFFRFMKTYFWKLGFLDGFAGFVIAVLHGYAGFVRYAKLREIWKTGEKIEPIPN